MQKLQPPRTQKAGLTGSVFSRNGSPARGEMWVVNGNSRSFQSPVRDEMWVSCRSRYPHHVPTGLRKTLGSWFSTHLTPLAGLPLREKTEAIDPNPSRSASCFCLTFNYFFSKKELPQATRKCTPLSGVGGSETPACSSKFSSHLFFLILFTLLPFTASTQDHYWWANNVGWDGQRFWGDYIIRSTRLLGPNALPIPRLGNGRVPNERSFALSGNSHFTPGDATQNLALYGTYNLVPDVISFELYWVPIEYFTLSHAIKTERKTFHIFYNEHLASGDIYLHTLIQLLKAETHPLDLALRIGYRFPSSTMLGMARYTDAPGYYLDLSFGKKLIDGNLDLSVQGMGGIFVWQINQNRQNQNDAALFGLGLNLEGKNWALSPAFRGYSGYLNNGDRPMALSLSGQFDLNPRWQLFGTLQTGLGDLLYDSFELGSKFRFSSSQLR